MLRGRPKDGLFFLGSFQKRRSGPSRFRDVGGLCGHETVKSGSKRSPVMKGGKLSAAPVVCLKLCRSFGPFVSCVSFGSFLSCEAVFIPVDGYGSMDMPARALRKDADL
jgi:hypothetical protein